MYESHDKNRVEDPTLNDEILGSHSEIASKLKQFYTAIQEEEIPDRFLDLLEKLDRAEKAHHNNEEKGT
ncbi:NepR family anti-sigma factor [Bartonella tamiae]|uniref:Anti-sigma factor NepR domain-containing protein n=1 Tax=Bartonella tamiae Th239 TaxID=1094558 RepID=J1K3C3_9HYPH|nr:NepR family anti-sigma factor [Bartonella tamiae]EJF91625.1 hypothetical protein ME5_00004 [Bartonella tamiae Th239]EJF92700.1 hypothetical protein MEG_01870 [Bartonella tamiae Th307]